MLLSMHGEELAVGLADQQYGGFVRLDAGARKDLLPRLANGKNGPAAEIWCIVLGRIAP